MLDQNLTLYRVFYAVANLGNISGAAEQLFISQPAVSQSIRKLEENMKCPLFVRKSRGVELTEEGKILYEHVEEALNVLNQAEASISSGIEEGKGHLRIGTNNALCQRYLLPYLNIFLQMYPKMHVSITCGSSENTMLALTRHEIDVALVHGQDVDKTMKAHPLGLLSVIFVAKAKYYKRLGPIVGDNIGKLFQKSTLVLLKKQDGIRQALDKALEKKHIKPQNILEANDLDVVLDFTRLGMGIGCIAKEFIEEELEAGTLVEVPVAIEFSPVEVAFVRLDESISNPALKKFREMLTNELSDGQ